MRLAEPMCPLCLSTLGWLALGGASAGGLGALLAKRCRKGNDDGDDHDQSSNGDT
jgi:hypothetical protein